MILGVLELKEQADRLAAEAASGNGASRNNTDDSQSQSNKSNSGTAPSPSSSSSAPTPSTPAANGRFDLSLPLYIISTYFFMLVVFRLSLPHHASFYLYNSQSCSLSRSPSLTPTHSLSYSSLSITTSHFLTIPL